MCCQGRLFAMGGVCAGRQLATVESFDPLTRTWRKEQVGVILDVCGWHRHLAHTRQHTNGHMGTHGRCDVTACELLSAGDAMP